MSLEITSEAFENGEAMPITYSCHGEDISPPLSWTGVPPETKSLALICDDPDAPIGTWVHWVLFNIPASVDVLPEAIPPEEEPEVGGRHGKNSWRKLGYGGPCPPSGTHRYFFRLYALDISLALPAGSGKKALLREMEGHILAQGELMGTFTKP